MGFGFRVRVREGGRRDWGLGLGVVCRCDGVEGLAAVVGAQQVCEVCGSPLHKHHQHVMPGHRRTHPASTAAQVVC